MLSRPWHSPYYVSTKDKGGLSSALESESANIVPRWYDSTMQLSFRARKRRITTIWKQHRRALANVAHYRPSLSLIRYSDHLYRSGEQKTTSKKIINETSGLILSVKHVDVKRDTSKILRLFQDLYFN